VWLTLCPYFWQGGRRPLLHPSDSRKNLGPFILHWFSQCRPLFVFIAFFKGSLFVSLFLSSLVVFLLISFFPPYCTPPSSLTPTGPDDITRLQVAPHLPSPARRGIAWGAERSVKHFRSPLHLPSPPPGEPLLPSFPGKLPPFAPVWLSSFPALSRELRGAEASPPRLFLSSFQDFWNFIPVVPAVEFFLNFQYVLSLSFSCSLLTPGDLAFFSTLADFQQGTKTFKPPPLRKSQIPTLSS